MPEGIPEQPVFPQVAMARTSEFLKSQVYSAEVGRGLFILVLCKDCPQRKGSPAPTVCRSLWGPRVWGGVILGTLRHECEILIIGLHHRNNHTGLHFPPKTNENNIMSALGRWR